MNMNVNILYVRKISRFKKFDTVPIM